MQTTTLENEHFEIITVEISPGVKAGQRKQMFLPHFFLPSLNQQANFNKLYYKF